MILRHNSKTSEWLVPGFQRILPDPVGKMGTCRKRGWRKKKRFDKCPNPAEILRVYYYNFPLPHWYAVKAYTNFRLIRTAHMISLRVAQTMRALPPWAFL